MCAIYRYKVIPLSSVIALPNFLGRVVIDSMYSLYYTIMTGENHHKISRLKLFAEYLLRRQLPRIPLVRVK